MFTLLQLCKKKKIDNFEDLVYNCKREEAARIIKNNEHAEYLGIETEEPELYNQEILDCKSIEASNINNQGLYRQLEYLLDNFSEDELISSINETKNSSLHKRYSNTRIRDPKQDLAKSCL